MIVFKTEMREMPISCNYCVVRHICKPELNLSPRDTKQIVPFLKDCPLLEIPDPKPEPTLTQHEHDLIEIIKKVHPNASDIYIKTFDEKVYLLLDMVLNITYQKGKTQWDYSEVRELDLFNKFKLPTLLYEFDTNTIEKQYNINDLLSRPIKKEI